MYKIHNSKTYFNLNLCFTDIGATFLMTVNRLKSPETYVASAPLHHKMYWSLLLFALYFVDHSAGIMGLGWLA